MNDGTTAGSLPNGVAWTLGSVSVALGVTVSEWYGAGAVGSVVATLVLMSVLALGYERIVE
ncbi:hypothetical protein [Halogeometricum luteum]|uniref:Uncharacterized protein n=1 Tax=Halogeometricum luteum TaxID=2950537 RepID=A0ABU2G574_9EURY|nr:hypothetical protein [Halogeometricum sp. S3BR5-2]MDS0295946.1 hypothetical protein [Halogeometricum sp. S3BR5-2]